jgi:putative mycofactocin binding protein MftB
VAPTTCFDPGGRWALSDAVSLRDEEFGALAYHHGTRRLVFLKSRELVELVRRLDQFDSAELALAATVAPKELSRYRSALASLASSEIIRGC